MKKTIALLLALCLCMGMWACSKASSSDKAADAQPQAGENDGSLTFFVCTVYDVDDQVISQSSHDFDPATLQFRELSIQDGVESLANLYGYNERGDLILEANYFDGSEFRRVESTYDESSNQTAYTVFFDGIEDSHEEYTYDENGNMLTLACFNGGVLGQQDSYTYSEDGIVLEHTSTFPTDDGTTTQRETTIIVEAGVETRYETYVDDQLTEYNIVTCSGNETLTIYYNSNGEERSRSLATEYENGDVLVVSSSDGAVYQRYSTTYADGIRTDESIEYMDGRQTRMVSKWDASDNLLEEGFWEEDQELERRTYTYDAQGRKTMDTVYSNGVEVNRMEYSYNDSGYLAEMKNYCDEQLETRTVYTYEQIPDTAETAAVLEAHLKYVLNI